MYTDISFVKYPLHHQAVLDQQLFRQWQQTFVKLQEQDGDMWQPANWVQLLQPIVNFLNQVVLRFGCNTEEQLSEVYSSVLSLQQTAQTFKQLERCSGDRTIINDLSNLAK